MLGLYFGTLREFFRDGGEDLHTFYRIDAEVAFQIHIWIDGIGGIAGLIGDDSEKNRQDLGRRRIMGNADDGRSCDDSRSVDTFG